VSLEAGHESGTGEAVGEDVDKCVLLVTVANPLDTAGEEVKVAVVALREKVELAKIGRKRPGLWAETKAVK
jgi:hypothetical protein